MNHMHQQMPLLSQVMFTVLHVKSCSQFCMWCSTSRYCWTLTTRTHPHSREYTDVQPFAMHRFWRGRASLNWLCINFGGELSTVTTLMFIVLHVLPNSFALFNPVQSIHRYAFFCNAPFSRMQSIPGKFMIHLTQLGTVLSSHVRWSTRMLNSLQQDIPNWSKKSLKTTSNRYKPYQWSKSLIKTHA